MKLSSWPQSSCSATCIVLATHRSWIALTAIFTSCSMWIPLAYGQIPLRAVTNSSQENVSDPVGKVFQDPISKSGPWLPENNTGETRQSLHYFEKLVAGSWEVTAASGTKMVHTWKWGPGKNSIERWTEGEDAKGDPWTELVVYYWQPQDNLIHVFGISPFQSGINQGTIQFNGESAITESILLQEKFGKRQMQTRWAFKSTNHYVETLLERNASGKLVELVSFNHYRVQSANKTIATHNKRSDQPTPFNDLNFLHSTGWQCNSEVGKQWNCNWSFDWIPVANFYYGEVREIVSNKTIDRSHFFIYRDTVSKTLRFISLCSNSEVFTGELTVAQSGFCELVRLQY